jgi:hypothetical protein
MKLDGNGRLPIKQYGEGRSPIKQDGNGRIPIKVLLKCIQYVN